MTDSAALDLPVEGEVAVSEAAAKRVAKILSGEPDMSALRVSVEGGGCSGFSYKFDLVEEPTGEDIIIEREGAQVVIDQFITSGEHKWERLCGLTLLLPHGYEGQGPEHSSARLERFLQLSAEHNIQVCVPSTPAQVFHMLRRQAIRPLRKPLVVMSPKSLLRHKEAISTLEELSDGQFYTVLDDTDNEDKTTVTRAVLCSGRIYYDLRATLRESGKNDVVLIRLEQLYPFPEKELSEILEPYSALSEVVWCQEEPMNQGAWYSSQHHMRRVIQVLNSAMYLEYAGRDASASPAAGYMALHVRQQEKFINEALKLG